MTASKLFQNLITQISLGMSIRDILCNHILIIFQLPAALLLAMQKVFKNLHLSANLHLHLGANLLLFSMWFAHGCKFARGCKLCT